MNLAGESKEDATVLVGISNPATVHGLMEFCSILSGPRPSDILLTHVVTVANQISLTTGKSSPEVVRARDFVQQTQQEAEARSINARGLVEVARSVDEGLLAAAESHRAGMILVGYSEWIHEDDQGGEEEFDRTMYRVARKAHTDVIVAKFRQESFDRVLVPVGMDAPGRLLAFLARAFSLRPEASVTFFHDEGLEASGGGGEARLEGWLAAHGLEEKGVPKVVRSDDTAQAILTESRSHDLVVVVPSKRPGLMEGIFSSKARTVAEESPASVLMAWERDSEKPG
jgi:nucleotide-binding universal stress UspA family protein